ncbi:MAG: serine protease [Burkholderiaceae bacterium]|jgi:S1-C subfamily serine protease|nr:serine protease [Burkholderiaceae bacterium]
MLAAAVACGAALAQAAPDPAATVERIKPSIVAVGTFQQTRQPQFRFFGTGFAVADGRLIATNAHVVPRQLDSGADPERLAIVIPSRDPNQRLVRRATVAGTSAEHDLALLIVDGPPLPPAQLGHADAVREGQPFLFTGFPVGSVLGLIPVTHQALLGAVTPITLPAGNAAQLDARVIRQQQAGSFDIFQLDAVAYPGSSGSPLYDPATGAVVGVINMTVARNTKESALPQPTGIAFAIPVRHLQALIESAR